MIDVIAHTLQAVIIVSGLTAAFLATSLTPRVRARAGLIGMAFQPVWLAAAWMDGQWGEFLLSVFYTGAWARMYLNNRKAV